MQIKNLPSLFLSLTFCLVIVLAAYLQAIAIEKIEPKNCNETNYNCFCEHKQYDKALIAIQKHIATCCPNISKTDNPNLKTPPIHFKRMKTRYKSCGYSCCGKNIHNLFSPEGITYYICSLANECPDVCNVLTHEMGHWLDCHENKSRKNECEEAKRHIEIHYDTYLQCKHWNPACGIECNTELNWVKTRCNDYKGKNCPIDEDIEQVCNG